MSLHHKSLTEITAADLQLLVDNEVREIKRIEFKRELPGGSDSDSREFLADVSSLANASGGDIFYGIAAEEGVAVEVVGLSGINVDGEKLRLENVLRSSLAPRIIGLQIQEIQLAKEAYVLVVRVPRSWNSPHMITFKGGSRFFSRNSAGKYQLDVTELRSAFLASESIGEKIKNFRLERLAKIVAGETPATVTPGPHVVLHVVPFGAFDPGTSVDLSDTTVLANKGFSTIGGGGNWRINFDGLMLWDGQDDPAQRSYTQLFRNGCIEAVDDSLIRYNLTNRSLHAPGIEREVIGTIAGYLHSLLSVGASPPFALMLSLLNVRGFRITAEAAPIRRDTVPIDRDNLLVPEVIVEETDFDLWALTKPLFDPIWNACGCSQSATLQSDGSLKR